VNDTRCDFRPGRSATDHISLSSKILRNLGSMLKTSSHALLTSRYDRVTCEKLWGVFDRFCAAYDRAGMKISTKIPRYYISPQAQGSVCGNTLQQVDKFKYLEVVFTSDGRRSARRWIHRLVKLTQFCVELYRFVDKTGSFKHRKAISFYIGLCCDPYLWLWS